MADETSLPGPIITTEFDVKSSVEQLRQQIAEHRSIINENNIQIAEDARKALAAQAADQKAYFRDLIAGIRVNSQQQRAIIAETQEELRKAVAQIPRQPLDVNVVSTVSSEAFKLIREELGALLGPLNGVTGRLTAMASLFGTFAEVVKQSSEHSAEALKAFHSVVGIAETGIHKFTESHDKLWKVVSGTSQQLAISSSGFINFNALISKITGGHLQFGKASAASSKEAFTFGGALDAAEKTAKNFGTTIEKSISGIVKAGKEAFTFGGAATDTAGRLGGLGSAAGKVGSIVSSIAPAAEGSGSALAGLGVIARTVFPVFVVVATAIAAVGSVLFKSGYDIAKLADEYDRIGQRIGATANQVQGLSLVAASADVPLASLTQGLTRLAFGLTGHGGAGQAGGGGDGVEDGSNRVQRSLKILIGTIRDSNGNYLSQIEILKRVSNQFQLMEDGELKTALAMEIFGRAGAELIPILNLGGAAIDKFMAESNALGPNLKNQADKMYDWNEAVKKVSLSWDKLKQALSQSGFLELITKHLEFAAKGVAELGDAIERFNRSLAIGYQEQSEALATSIEEGIKKGALTGNEALTDESKKAVQKMSEYLKAQTDAGHGNYFVSLDLSGILPEDAASRIKTELDEIAAKANKILDFRERDLYLQNAFVAIAQKEANFGDLRYKNAEELLRLEQQKRDVAERAELATRGGKEAEDFLKETRKFHEEIDKLQSKYGVLGGSVGTAFKTRPITEMQAELNAFIKKIDDAKAAIEAFGNSATVATIDQLRAQEALRKETLENEKAAKLLAEETQKAQEKAAEETRKLIAEKKRLGEEYNTEASKAIDAQAKQLGSSDRILAAQNRIKALNEQIAETLRNMSTVPAHRPFDAATKSAEALREATKNAHIEAAKPIGIVAPFQPKPIINPLFPDQSGINAAPAPITPFNKLAPAGAFGSAGPALPQRKGDTPEILAKKIDAMNAYRQAMALLDAQQAKLIAEDRRFDQETEARTAAIAKLDAEIEAGGLNEVDLANKKAQKASLEDTNKTAIDEHKKAQDDINLIIYQATQDYEALNQALAANVALNAKDQEALKGLLKQLKEKQEANRDERDAERAKRTEDAAKLKSQSDEVTATAKLAGENAKLDDELAHVNDKLFTLRQRLKEAQEAKRQDTEQLQKYNAALIIVNADPTAGEKTKQVAQQLVIDAKKKLLEDDKHLAELEAEQAKQVFKVADAWAALNDILAGFGVRTPKVIEEINKMLEGLNKLYKLIQFINAARGISIPVEGGASGVNLQGGVKGFFQSLFGGKQNLSGTGAPGSTDLGGAVDANGIPLGQQAPFPISGKGAFGGIGGSTAPPPNLFSGAGAAAAAGPVLGGAGVGAGIGAAFGGTTGAVGGGVLGASAGLAGAASLGLVGGGALVSTAIPIVGAVVGAAMLVIGILHQRALAETQKTVDRIQAQFKQVVDSFNNANVTLGATLAQLQTQRNDAFTRLASQTGGWDQLTKLIPQLDAQIAQLKKQQTDLIKGFNENIGTLRFPTGIRDTVSAITDLNTKIRDFINAGGSAATAAEYLARSLAQIKTDAQTNLISTEQGVVNLLLQQIDLERQKAQITRDAALAEYNLLNQGVISRTRSVAQNQASQLLEIRRQRDLDLVNINQQIDTTKAQIGGQQQLFNLTKDRTTLMAQQVQLQTALTNQTVLQVQSQIKLAGILATIKPGGTGVDLNKILTAIGGAVQIPGLPQPSGKGSGIFDPTDFLLKASSEQFGQNLLKQITGQKIPTTLTQAQELQIIQASQAFPNQTVNVKAFTKALQDIFNGQQLLLQSSQIPGGASTPIDLQTSIATGGTTAATAIQSAMVTAGQTAATTIANAVNGIQPTSSQISAPAAQITSISPAAAGTIGNATVKSFTAQSASKTVSTGPTAPVGSQPTIFGGTPAPSGTVSRGSGSTATPIPVTIAGGSPADFSTYYGVPGAGGGGVGGNPAGFSTPPTTQLPVVNATPNKNFLDKTVDFLNKPITGILTGGLSTLFGAIGGLFGLGGPAPPSQRSKNVAGEFNDTIQKFNNGLISANDTFKSLTDIKAIAKGTLTQDDPNALARLLKQFDSVLATLQPLTSAQAQGSIFKPGAGQGLSGVVGLSGISQRSTFLIGQFNDTVSKFNAGLLDGHEALRQLTETQRAANDTLNQEDKRSLNNLNPQFTAAINKLTGELPAAVVAATAPTPNGVPTTESPIAPTPCADPGAFTAPFLPFLHAASSLISTGNNAPSPIVRTFGNQNFPVTVPTSLSGNPASKTVPTGLPDNTLQRLTPGLLGGAGNFKALQPTITASAPINVGAVTINVSGTTNMNGPDLSKAVTAGLHQAFTDLRARRGANINGA